MNEVIKSSTGNNIIIAERVLLIDGIRWAAVVTRLEDGVTYQLWFEHGSTVRKSGQFSNAKALVKYIKEKTEARINRESNFGRKVEEVKNTLADLSSDATINVVPICFSKAAVTHGRNCNKCPYRSECERNTVFVSNIKEDDNTPAEDDGDFLNRLQKKLSSTKWEGGNGNAID